MKHPVPTLHYGEVGTFACRSNHKVVNFGKLFLCQYSSNTWKIWHEACLTPQKSGNEKKIKKINMQGGEKNKKPEGGVCDRQKGCQKICYDECYDICFLNFYHKHPLMRKKCI